MLVSFNAIIRNAKSKNHPAVLYVRILDEFMHYKKDIEKIMAGDKQVKITIENKKKKRTLKQNAMFHSICAQIAKKLYSFETKTQQMTKKEALNIVKQSIKEFAVTYDYPEVIMGTAHGKVKIPKGSSSCSTKEFGILMECAFVEAHYHGVDIREETTAFRTWRNSQEVDPLNGSYKSTDEYRERHPVCEVCGKWLGTERTDGVWKGELMHLVTRAQGADYSDCWIIHACPECHRKQHKEGWNILFRDYPHMKTIKENADKLWYKKNGGFCAK